MRPSIESGWGVFTVLLAAFLVSLSCAGTGGKVSDEAVTKKARSHLDLGVDYMRTGRLALGLRELLIAEDLDPKNAKIQFAIAEAYLRQGRAEEAEVHLRRTLELYPDYHDARLNLSGLYLKLGRYEEAMAESAILVDDATFPAPWRALSNQGWAAYQLGRRAEARQFLELAYEYNSSHWKTLLSLGILEMEEGHRLEAVEYFQKVLDLEPGPHPQAEANYRLGEIFVSLGKRERAVGHLMAAVVETPGGPWGKKSEEYLKLLR